MKNRYKAALEQNGKNTDQYLSLQIKKSDLPNGSAVVIMIKDEKTGELRPISTNNLQTAKDLACNSQFYGKTMADGYVFNPYIHRRFIAAQFRQLIKLYGCYGVTDGFRKSRSWSYAISILCKEVHTLSMLERKDRTAFNERSRFFTIEASAKILSDYAADVAHYIDNRGGFPQRGRDAFIPGVGYVRKENIRPLKYRFTRLAQDAQKCRNYAMLNALLEGFEWLDLPGNYDLPESFAKPYLESGAFYTLKHHMMFEGLRMYRSSSAPDSLARLQEHRSSYLSLYPNLMP